MMDKKYSYKIISIILIIILIGIISSLYSIRYADKVMRDSLLEKTQIISTTLNSSDILTFTGTENDILNPQYLEVKSKLIELVKINSDIRFAYISGKKGNDIFFFVDSEQPNSPDYSPPGQPYPEATDVFKNIFNNKLSITEGPVNDRWGSWISALSPIVDTDNQQVVGVIGLDISSRDYYETLIVYGSIPVLISALFLILIIFTYREQKKNLYLLNLKSNLVSIAVHDLRTPIVGIRWLLDSLVDSKENTFTAEQIQSLELIRKTNTELLNTASKILEVNKIDSVKKK